MMPPTSARTSRVQRNFKTRLEMLELILEHVGHCFCAYLEPSKAEIDRFRYHGVLLLRVVAFPKQLMCSGGCFVDADFCVFVFCWR